MKWWESHSDGHASIKTTLDTYGHLMEGLDEAAADQLQGLWRGAPAEFPRSAQDLAEDGSR